MTKHIRTEWANVTYTIEITEHERIILVEALANAGAVQHRQAREGHTGVVANLWPGWEHFRQLREFFNKTLPETKP